MLERVGSEDERMCTVAVNSAKHNSYQSVFFFKDCMAEAGLCEEGF